ncbi:STAS domain-containing protein [Streptomyces sp. NPDC005890]|uniref:STAS domain-containing protein n=1 Tax=Streptomyces sp. NPDC005890 TaxID=3154568 RepID=UPI0033C0AFE6
MTDNLTLTTTHADGHLALVCVSGEIDIRSAPLLRTDGLRLINQGHPDLILDLAQVTFCDSSGFNALINILRCARAANGSLTLAAVPDRLSRMLDLTGVSALMPAYSTVDAAMRARLDTAPEPL